MGDNTHANTFFLGGKHDGTEQGQETGKEIRTLHRRQGLLHSPRPVRSGDRRFRLVTAGGYEDKYVWPVDGAVLRPYAMTALAYDETMSDWRTHDGIDIEAKYGTVVSAVASGTVTKVYYDDLYGTTVVTEREDGLRCMYANLESIPTVNVGDQVSVGDTIGSVGDSAGCESAQESHLHLSVAASGQSVSPLDYLPQKN